MTRDQIAQKIRRDLNDLGVTYYNATDINDSIQDGYDEVAVYCECIERSAILNFKDNTTYYDMSVLLPDYYRTVRIYSYLTKRFLHVNLERENFAGSWDWEVNQGTHYDFLIKGPKYIGISLRKTNAEGNFKIWYKAQANVLGPSDVPRIDNKFQLMLENYGIADLLEQNQEYTKANTYWTQYNKQLEDYRHKIQLLSQSDRLIWRDGNAHSPHIYKY